MKKPFEVLFLLIAAFLLINCGGGGGGGGGAAAPSTTSTNETTTTTSTTTTSSSSSSSGSSNSSGSSGSSSTTPTYFGTKSPTEPKAVKDIVFSDGSATPYTSGLTLTDAQKNAAVAVIFYKGTECSNDGSTRTLGVGLKRSSSGMQWCKYSSGGHDRANGYNTKVTTIQCTPSGSAGTYTFTGDKNGSDNLLQIASFLAGNNDTGTAGNYPAFEYAKNYGSTNGCSGAYANGWYLPSIAELYQIYNQKVSIDLAITLCGWANTFSNTFFWSSTQYGSSNWVAYSLNVYNGAFGGVEKESTSMTSYPLCVCAIREF